MDGAGRQVLFESQATDLAPAGTSGRNVFLHDLDRGTTTLISTNFTTAQGLIAIARISRGGAISEDGRWTAFIRSTTPSDFGELFVRNAEGQILRVDPQSVSVPTVVLAPDGSHVAYVSRLGGRSGLRVRRLPTLELVRELSLGAFPPRSLAFTPDARRLLLSTTHPLAAADTNGRSDVYLVGLGDDTVDWVSSGIAGAVPGGHSDQPSISRDGRVLAFRSLAPDVALGGAAESSQVVVRDFSAGIIWRLSTPASPGLREPSSGGVVAGDGRSAVFQSFWANQVAGDFNDSQDIFHAALAPPATVDSDGDGLPDAWELWNLGSLTSTGLQDNDGDGVSNAVEYRTKTHPGQATSRLELALPEFSADRVAVSWSAVPGVSYVLERADELGGPWVTVERVPPSSGGMTRINDVPSDNAVYRVVVPSSTPN